MRVNKINFLNESEKIIKNTSSNSSTCICSNQEDEANKKYKAIFEASLDAIVLLDTNTQKFVECNQRALQMYGYTQAEFLQLQPKDLDVVYDVEAIKQMQEHILSQGYFQFETKHKTKKGNILDVVVSAAKIYLNDSYLMYVTFHDITNLKRMYEIKLEQQKEFETIFELAKEGIAILDLNSRFIRFNDTYLQLTGYTKEELFNKSCLELTPKEEQESSKIVLQSVFAGNSIGNFEKKCVQKNGETIVVNMSLALMPDGKRVLITAKDMTNLKRMESQTKLAAMGEMIGNIAHQWRQPLSVISTIASGLKMRQEFGDFDGYNFGADMKIVIEQTQYLSKTIDDFRNFIKENKTYEEVSLKDVIESSVSLLQATMKNHFITLEVLLEGDKIILGNKNELQQVFLNLVNNSKDVLLEQKALDEKVILITAKIVDEVLEIKVLDNGGGINEAIMPRVFEPYFTTKHQTLGTGLGLSMVDKIIRQRHNQDIKVHNETFIYHNHEYQGACFTILISDNTLLKI